ncbi:hypothetical protein BDZ45DRAFT_684831 [Acephala macrosclerotiorum]|nr:hypothetical protein BDZ45DRAFT_684831 [Acephala macrosclerotiorum]
MISAGMFSGRPYWKLSLCRNKIIKFKRDRKTIQHIVAWLNEEYGIKVMPKKVDTRPRQWGHRGDLRGFEPFKSRLLGWYEEQPGFPEMVALFRQNFDLDTSCHIMEKSVLHWTNPNWWRTIYQRVPISLPLPNLPIDLYSASKLQILEHGTKDAYLKERAEEGYDTVAGGGVSEVPVYEVEGREGVEGQGVGIDEEKLRDDTGDHVEDGLEIDTKDGMDSLNLGVRGTVAVATGEDVGVGGSATSETDEEGGHSTTDEEDTYVDEDDTDNNDTDIDEDDADLDEEEILPESDLLGRNIEAQINPDSLWMDALVDVDVGAYGAHLRCSRCSNCERSGLLEAALSLRPTITPAECIARLLSATSEKSCKGEIGPIKSFSLLSPPDVPGSEALSHYFKKLSILEGFSYEVAEELTAWHGPWTRPKDLPVLTASHLQSVEANNGAKNTESKEKKEKQSTKESKASNIPRNHNPSNQSSRMHQLLRREVHWKIRKPRTDWKAPTTGAFLGSPPARFGASSWRLDTDPTIHSIMTSDANLRSAQDAEMQSYIDAWRFVERCETAVLG